MLSIIEPCYAGFVDIHWKTTGSLKDMEGEWIGGWEQKRYRREGLEGNEGENCGQDIYNI